MHVKMLRYIYKFKFTLTIIKFIPFTNKIGRIELFKKPNTYTQRNTVRLFDTDDSQPMSRHNFKRPLQIEIVDDDQYPNINTHQNTLASDKIIYDRGNQQDRSACSSASKVYLTEENMPEPALSPYEEMPGDKSRTMNIGMDSLRKGSSDYEISSSGSSSKKVDNLPRQQQQPQRSMSYNSHHHNNPSNSQPLTERQAYVEEENKILKQKIVDLQETMHIQNIQKHELLQIIKELTTNNQELKQKLDTAVAAQDRNNDVESRQNHNSNQQRQNSSQVMVLRGQLSKLKQLYRQLEQEIDHQRNYSRKLEEDLKEAMDYQNAYINAQSYLNRNNSKQNNNHLPNGSMSGQSSHIRKQSIKSTTQQDKQNMYPSNNNTTSSYNLQQQNKRKSSPVREKERNHRNSMKLSLY